MEISMMKIRKLEDLINGMCSSHTQPFKILWWQKRSSKKKIGCQDNKGYKKWIKIDKTQTIYFDKVKGYPKHEMKEKGKEL